MWPRSVWPAAKPWPWLSSGSSGFARVTTAAYLTLVLLLAATIAFATGRWRPDAVAVLVLLVLLLSGVLDLQAGLAGFGSPALIAVAAVFVVSAALERVGIAATLGRRIFQLAGRSEGRLILAFSLVAGMLSGFMNSIGAMAVLLPAAMATAREARISPSRLLLPLALGTRLGGNLTLIAGPSNLIASDALARAGYRPFSFFEFLPIGGTFLIAGAAFVALVGRRWLPQIPVREGPQPGRLMDLYRLQERLFEVRIPDESPLVGKTIAESDLGKAFGLTVISIARGPRHIVAPPRDELIRGSDTLIVQGRLEDLPDGGALHAAGLGELRQPTAPVLESYEVQVAEVILAPRSHLAGTTLREVGFREKYGVTVLAIWREGRPRRTALVDLPIQHGDALLVQGRRDRIGLLARDPDFLVLEAAEQPAPRSGRAPWALLGVVVMIATSLAGLPIATATLVAASIVVVAGCLSAEEVYRAIDWRAVVFIGAILPLGTALTTSGAADVLVRGVLGAFGTTPLLAMATLLAISIVLNQLMPSIATVALLAPIALQAAATAAANPHAFMMAVIAGTGTTFTPISNPVNLLVMGPGGYQMRDYVRVGSPLAVLLGFVGLAIIPLFWPLNP